MKKLITFLMVITLSISLVFAATAGERNALSSAKRYLTYMPFSYQGLVEQLEFEGYSMDEAKYGADNCGANWNEQAVLKAEQYLNYSAFSYNGLIEQLEFEGFTHEQAKYGVDHTPLGNSSSSSKESSSNTNNASSTFSQQQALRSAETYLKYSAFSKKSLINQLEFEGFSNSDATYAAEHCGADWNEQAFKCAQSYLLYSSFSYKGLVDQLKFEGFTSSQAEYGASKAYK